MAEEFELLKEAYPNAVYQDRWVLLPTYTLPESWSSSEIEVTFFFKPPYPAASPYGIYTPLGLTFDGKTPSNFKPAKPVPPFSGSWGVFSWQAEPWIPGGTASDGHNMLTWATGMQRRFLEGI